MWQRVGFEQVDISDEILRIVIFQEMVSKTFRQKKSFDKLLVFFENKTICLGCLRYFDFDCNRQQSLF